MISLGLDRLLSSGVHPQLHTERPLTRGLCAGTGGAGIVAKRLACHFRSSHTSG